MTTGPGGPPDLYQVLGVGPAASGEEITRAWRARLAWLVLRYLAGERPW